MTVKPAVPACPSNNATMVAVPGSSPIACPSLMVATDGMDDVHEAKGVRFWVLPSANVPMAWNASPDCGSMLAVSGEIWIDVSGDASTVIAESPVTDPNCALMVALPPEFAITLPPVLTLATSDADEVQATKFVITRVVPSLNIAVATQFTKVAGASTAVDGVTEIEETVAELTYSGTELVTPTNVQEMLAVPGPTAFAMPTPPIVATARLSEAHVHSLVMS